MVSIVDEGDAVDGGLSGKFDGLLEGGDGQVVDCNSEVAVLEE